MPVEITTAIGIPDTGFGIDYYEADYIYPSLEALVEAFAQHGFKVITSDHKFSLLFNHQECRTSQRDATQELL
jgi:hypothetical protein